MPMHKNHNLSDNLIRFPPLFLDYGHKSPTKNFTFFLWIFIYLDFPFLQFFKSSILTPIIYELKTLGIEVQHE